MPRLIEITEQQTGRRDTPGGPFIAGPSRWLVEVELDNGETAELAFRHPPTNDEIRAELRARHRPAVADIVPETPANLTRGDLDADLDRHLLRAAGLEALRAQAQRDGRGAVVTAIDNLVANVTLDQAVAMAQAYIAASP